jgi:cell division septation protein DedD
MAVEGQGGTAFAASEGADPKGAIDTNAVAEAPVTPVRQAPAPKAAPPVQPAAPKQPAPAPAPVPSGPSIQLGAFSSQAGANSAWKTLSGRFSYLAPLTHSVSTTSVNGRTFYRLRASGPGAANVCGRLRAAGEICQPVG